MDSDAATYAKSNYLARQYAGNLIEKLMPALNEDSEILMDIGCGLGNATRDILIPAFPMAKKVIAFDVIPSLIEYARSNNAHPLITYYIFNVEDSQIMKRWNGSISKVFSSLVFHWVRNQEIAFKNVFEVLKNDGEAMLLLMVKSNHFDMNETIKESPKWKKYIQDADTLVPESHRRENNATFYRKILQDIGFVVLTCEEEERTFIHKNDEILRGELSSICPFTELIPAERKTEFVDDIFGYIVKRCGRAENGLPQYSHTLLYLHLRKP